MKHNQSEDHGAGITTEKKITYLRRKDTMKQIGMSNL